MKRNKNIRMHILAFRSIAIRARLLTVTTEIRSNRYTNNALEYLAVLDTKTAHDRVIIGLAEQEQGYRRMYVRV